jgi:hypothetical protein
MDANLSSVGARDEAKKMKARRKVCKASWIVLVLTIVLWNRGFSGRARSFISSGDDGDVVCDASRWDLTAPMGVFFTRVPKTGSTTCWEYFRERAKIDNFTHVRRDICSHCGKRTIDGQSKHHISTAHDMHEAGANFIWSGHSHYIQHTKLPLNTQYIASVRHPVARKRSTYAYFWPRKRTGAYDRCMCTNETTFDECVISAQPECYKVILDLGHDQVSYFCGYDDVCMENPDSEEALQLALKHMQRYLVVGLTEETEDFLLTVTKLVPFLTFNDWKYPETKKTTTNTTDRVSSEAVRKILEYNRRSTELKFYEAVVRRYSKLKECLFAQKLAVSIHEDAVELLVQALNL